MDQVSSGEAPQLVETAGTSFSRQITCHYAKVYIYRTTQCVFVPVFSSATHKVELGISKQS
jgi:hypothetical protein